MLSSVFALTPRTVSRLNENTGISRRRASPLSPLMNARIEDFDGTFTVLTTSLSCDVNVAEMFVTLQSGSSPSSKLASASVDR